VTTPSKQRRAPAFLGDLMPPATTKTRARAEGGTKKGRFYRPLPEKFGREGFHYRQIARDEVAAIYAKRWTGCAEPSLSYEVIRIRRRDGFQIGEKFIEPAEVYPKSEAWGVDGFTFTDRNKAWAKFSEISLGEPARK